jgi:hypothetical protein
MVHPWSSYKEAAKDSLLMASEVASGELWPSPGGTRRGFLIGGRGDGSPRACTYNQGAPDQGAFDVRYAPDSGANADIADGPSRATSGLMHCSNLHATRSPRRRWQAALAVSSSQVLWLFSD